MTIDTKKPLLVMDASVLRDTQVGIFVKNKWLLCEHSANAPLQSLFFLVEGVLQYAGLTIVDIGSYVFCQGPGSLLGIRLAAMAIRTWKAIDKNDKKPVYGYSSMAALQCMVSSKVKKSDRDSTYLVRPLRQNTWTVCKFLTPLEQMELSDGQMKGLKGKVFGIEGDKAPPCSEYEKIPYLLDHIKEADFLKILFEVENGAIDAKVAQPPTFKKWTQKRCQSS